MQKALNRRMFRAFWFVINQKATLASLLDEGLREVANYVSD